MVKSRGKKSIPKHKFKDYKNVAEHFYNAAEDSMDLEYYTAAGVLIVHSAIALVESIVIDTEEKKKAVNQLYRIIEEKTKVSYLGELYTISQTKDMWKRLERYRKWAIEILER